MTPEQEKAWGWLKNDMAYRPPEQLGSHEQQLKAAFTFGWQKGHGEGVRRGREECAGVADKKAVAAVEAEPIVGTTEEAVRAGHFAVAAEQISDAIRALGEEGG